MIFILYCILRTKPYEQTAGIKAPDDVAKICRSLGGSVLKWRMLPVNKSVLFVKTWVFLITTLQWMTIMFKVRTGDVVLYQHPSYGYRISLMYVKILKKIKRIDLVALIHDLESLRKGIEGGVNYNEKRSNIGDIILLKEFDKVICHNVSMENYLIKNGFSPSQLISLDIFDYLIPEDIDIDLNNKPLSYKICIAGNLSVGKSKYIYEFAKNNPNISVNLYGVNYEEMNYKNLHYQGCYSPDELPLKLDGCFGLVWDGYSSETCQGNTGEYLRYNNPHKTSLYLVSGIPVIVWSEAAISKFVLENNVGIAVDSINDIKTVLDTISETEYFEMCKNALAISVLLRKGHFLLSALSKI